ncbi:MAG: quercetin 2,3-dioxygenase, partial [Pseudomonadota bacterium]
RLVASGDGREGSVLIHQDAAIYATIMTAGDSLKHELAAGRNAYVHVIRGEVSVNGVALQGGDALKITAETLVTLQDAKAAEVLVFDLPN